ncbi:MAG TPA: ATP-binding protein [Nitrospira sp.]|nr:ATP-binding protein [Nitrospira sp.]
MFRPVPVTARFRGVPLWLMAAVFLALALVLSFLLLLGLQQDRQLLQDFSKDGSVPAERFAALWQSRRDLVLVALLVFVAAAGTIGAVIAFLHYDSARRTLEAVKGLARNILESIPTGILTLNQSGVITAVNPAAEVVLTRSSGDLLGHAYESVFAPGDVIRHVLDTALRRQEHVRQQDLPYQGRDRVSRTIRVTTAELTGDDGLPAGIILQAQDVTDWLALEQRVRVAEKLSALHTLSAGVAHELRNPLSAVDLNLHLLEDELARQAGSWEEADHYIRILNAECRRMSAILDTFMKFAGPGSLGLHEVDVPSVIDYIISLMRFEADERSIRLEHSVEDGLPSVLGDETQISQVLVNVMANSFHAMPRGGRCRVEARHRRGNGQEWVDITVGDTGSGIKKEDIARLFEPFYTTKSEGTGLGLAIAYRIMHDHGGTIHVSSEHGQGTIVLLQFPAATGQSRPVTVTA